MMKSLEMRLRLLFLLRRKRNLNLRRKPLMMKILMKNLLLLRRKRNLNLRRKRNLKKNLRKSSLKRRNPRKRSLRKKKSLKKNLKRNYPKKRNQRKNLKMKFLRFVLQFPKMNLMKRKSLKNQWQREYLVSVAIALPQNLVKSQYLVVAIIRVKSIVITTERVNVRLKRICLVTLLRQKRRKLFLQVNRKIIFPATHLQLQSLAYLVLLLRWVVDPLLWLLVASSFLRRPLKRLALQMMRILFSLDVPAFLVPVLSPRLHDHRCLLLV